MGGLVVVLTRSKPMELPATIRTSVSQQAITKVTRLFNGTLADVLNELLQNARRAGATAVHLETLDLAGRSTLCIRDDGHGIADPRSALTLGLSGWDQAVRNREDPAGMGVFSLAGHRVEIRSRAPAASAGWRVVVPADAWQGNAELPIERFEMDHGTELLIELSERWETELESAASACARHFPLPVKLNRRELARAAFLDGAQRVEHHQGCAIGVYRSREVPLGSPTVNFHGVAVK